MVRLPEQLLPLQEPEPEREAVLPLAPVAVAEREQLLPLQLPCALNELVPRGPETDELRSQAKALVAMERARTPIRAAVEMMFFIFHLVCVAGSQDRRPISCDTRRVKGQTWLGFFQPHAFCDDWCLVLDNLCLGRGSACGMASDRTHLRA